jgi:hypothetical protein
MYPSELNELRRNGKRDSGFKPSNNPLTKADGEEADHGSGQNLVNGGSYVGNNHAEPEK